MMIDFNRFWSDPGEDDGPRPGLSDKTIRDWEERHGVKLPGSLGEAFRRGDGGSIRFTDLEILPLGQIVPMEDDFWLYEEIPGDEAEDHALVFRLGYENTVGGQLLLNYNAGGPEAEPSVYIFHNDGCGASLVADSLDEFLARMLTFTAVPMVDWSASKEGIEVVAREGFDVQYDDAGRARVEQVLGREGQALVLFTREEGKDGVRLAKLILPLPLDPHQAEIRPSRPGPSPTFGLYLHPEVTERIIGEFSEQIEDGRWDNRTTQGGPVYGLFESTDRGRLEALRSLLLGPRAAIRPRSESMKSDPGASDRLRALSPEDRRVATLLAGRKLKAEYEAKLASGADPAEAMFARHMIERMDASIAAALAEGAPEDPDPETLRRVRAALWPDDPGPG